MIREGWEGWGVGEHTQWARRPSWEIVSMILSVKRMEVAVVGMPAMVAVACLVRAG